jgi:hypothetical protein
VVLLGALTPADFETPMTGERFARFDDFVQQSMLTDLIVMVKLWSKDGTLIYTST